MMKDDYMNAIENLVNGKFDQKEFCVEMAKKYPNIFNQVINEMGNGVSYSTTAEEQFVIDNYYGSSKKITAIKAHRMKYGTGLKEAKDRVDEIVEKFKLD